MVQRYLYLVRHGHYTDTAATADGLGGSLTATGIEQAQLIAQRLAALPIGSIFHSPLRRAVETAEQIAALLPQAVMTSDPDLRECIPGFPAALAPFFASIPAERIAQDRVQADRAFSNYFRPGEGTDQSEQHDLLVCHGNIIRYFICRVLQAPAEHWPYAVIHHCGFSHVVIKADGVAGLIAHNDTGHLATSLLSTG